MDGLQQRSNKWYSLWKLNGKRTSHTIKLDVDGGAYLTPKQSEKLAKRISDIWKDVAQGKATRRQGEDAIKAIPSLPPLVLNNALDRVRALAVADGFGNMPSMRQYLNEFVGTGVPKTQHQRRATFTLFLSFLNEKADRRLDAINNNDCVGFCKFRLADVSRGSVKRECDYIKAALTKAVKDRLIDVNPFEGIDYKALNKEVNPELGEDKQEKEPFSKEEIRILCFIIAAPWRDAVLLSYLTGGQRLGDIVCMKWEQVNIEAGSISFYTDKTGAKLKVIMHSILKERLQMLYDNRIDDIYIFPDLRYTYEVKDQGSTLSNEFTSIVKALGFPVQRKKADLKGNRRYIYPKTFHSIRHTAVSALRSSGVVSPDVARAIVGHESEEIERQYFTAMNEDLQKGYSHLADSLS